MHFSYFLNYVKGYRRPFSEEFMKFCLERFEVGLWSSGMELVTLFYIPPFFILNLIDYFYLHCTPFITINQYIQA